MRKRNQEKKMTTIAVYWEDKERFRKLAKIKEDRQKKNYVLHISEDDKTLFKRLMDEIYSKMNNVPDRVVPYFIYDTTATNLNGTFHVKVTPPQ